MLVFAAFAHGATMRPRFWLVLVFTGATVLVSALFSVESPHVKVAAYEREPYETEAEEALFREVMRQFAPRPGASKLPEEPADY